MTPAPSDTSIPTLGPCLIHSPLHRIGGVEAPYKTDEVDRILDKIAFEGMSSLTRSERETLARASRRRD